MKIKRFDYILLLGFLILLSVGSDLGQEPPPTLESTIIGVPEFIKAGEDLQFTIKLDRAPTFSGGVVQFYIAANATTISTSTLPISAGQKDIPVTFHIPATARGGKGTIHIYGFWTGLESLPIKSSDVSFEVLPNSNLIFPSSAEIQINPSQVQLFRRAAFALQLQVQSFKAVLAQSDVQNSSASLEPVIRRHVGEALEALAKTQVAFRGLASADTQGDAERVFFEDLRLSYEEVLKGLRKDQKKLAPMSREIGAPASLLRVSQQKAPQPNYPLVAQAALRPFEQNEAAYNLAANAQSLVFDLTVESNPAGASVCYHRRPDPCHQNPDATNTVLKSLPLAIWIVKFEKSGYKTEQREHDPFRESNHVINVNLQP